MYNIFNGGFSLVLLIILFVVVFSKISNIKFRLTVLEKKAQAEPVTPSVADTPQAGTALNSVALPITNKQDIQQAEVAASYNGPTSSDSSDKFISWLKDDWLLKLGGLLLLIGLGWFTTYAFVNNWIGELGRITLGITVGALVMALGSWRIRKYINQGGIFLVVGSAIILLTTFAAREFYDMFTPLFALGIMLLSTAYISLISVKYNAFAVSLSGLVLAFIAPLLTNSASVNEVGLFSYLMVVVLGAIWIVAIKQNWGALILASLVGVALYSIPIVSSSRSDESLIWFAYAFAALFFLTSIINIINSKENDIKAFLWTAIGNGAFLLVWVTSFVSEEWQSSIIALWMLIFAVGSFIAFSTNKIKSVFFVYAGVALAMLVVATTIELDGAALIVAYALESFLVPVLIYFTTKDLHASTVGSILMAVPTIMSISYLYEYYSGRAVLSGNFFVVFLMIVLLIALGVLYKKVKTVEISSAFYLDTLYLIVGSVYAYVLLWSVLHVLISVDTVAVTFSLVIFTIFGLVKYFYGISVGSRTLRNYGGLLIAFVILRLLFIDIWNMEMGAKVFVFILIGVLLMGTAFISRRIKSGFIQEQVN